MNDVASGLYFIAGGTGGIASAICWLSSPEPSWGTGQVLHLDGSMSTVQARYSHLHPWP